jgi:pimeloyl-ACP methyl ester carboxylesterase
MDFLAIEQACVIGLSLGGAVAIDFAIEYPERAWALITVDALLGGFQLSEDFYQALEEVVTNARNEGITAALERVREDPSDRWAVSMQNDVVKNRLEDMHSAYSGFHLLNPDPDISLDPPAIDRLSEIHVPVLAIVGELDAADFHKIADTLVAEIRGAEKAMISGGGHLINMEKPGEFNAVVLSFLRRIGGD